MKKILPLFALMFAFEAHASCTVYSSTSSSEVSATLDAHGWGFKNYAQICAKLNQANAEFLVQANATVLGGRSIGWAAIAMKDRNSAITTAAYGGLATRLSVDAGMDVAANIMMEAINQAVDLTDIDQAIKSLNAARQAARVANLPKKK